MKKLLMFVVVLLFASTVLPAYAQKYGPVAVNLKDGPLLYNKQVEVVAKKVAITDVSHEEKKKESKSGFWDSPFNKDKEGEKKESQFKWDFSLEMSSIVYEEPRLISEVGAMRGGSLTFTYTYNKHLKAVFEYISNAGEVTYYGYSSSSDVDINNIPDEMVEMRFIQGSEYEVSNNAFIMPFIGIGSRLLVDNLQKGGEGGYRRESNYVYYPIGMEVNYLLDKTGIIGINMEYDIFGSGVQKSRYKDIDPGLSNLENEQRYGKGYKLSLSYKNKYGAIDYNAKLFGRFWDIEDSERDNVYYNGILIGYGWEPKNNSTQLGVSLGIIL